MVTNVSEKDKTLQQVIDYCKSKRKDCRIMYTRTTNHNHDDRMILCAGMRAYGHIIDYCTHMLGYSGSMPSEVPNHSEDANMTMNKDQGHAVWRESIEKYGKEMQSIVCMEECSELIQAVSKRLRGKPDATDNLAEEMADVIICLHLLQEMYGITDEQLEEWIACKTARQSKRMQGDDPFMKNDETEMWNEQD